MTGLFRRLTLGALKLGVGAAAFFGLMTPGAAHGAEPTLAQNNILRVAISQGGDTAVSEMLNLSLGKAAIVELPIDAADVLMSSPGIADAIIRTPRRVYVLGLEIGQTNAFFFDDDGGQILNLEIRVERDVAPVQDMINELLPDSRITVQAMNDNIVLSGMADSAASAARARDIALRFVDGAEKVVSTLAVSGGEQVLLTVRVVEMQRTLVKQLGINLNGTTNFGEFTPPVRRALTEVVNGVPTPVTDQFGNVIYETVQEGSFASSSTLGTDNQFSLAGRTLGGLAAGLGYQNYVDGVLQSSLGATLNALERVGLVRTLAEPNLTAISGEAANFLAGGEFPVPSGRDSEGNVLIEYKPFGVGLSFTPVVLSEGRISLYVSTEVSELTDQGSVELSGSTYTDPDTGQIVQIPGLTLPGLKVRRAETTLELPSGGSMVMAGLIQDRTRQNIDGTPGLKDAPGIGALFRARDLESEETELVVVVTPYLVSPASADEFETPSDGYQTPGEFDSIFFGRLNRVYGAPGADVEGRFWRGPVGFILDEGR